MSNAYYIYALVRPEDSGVFDAANLELPAVAAPGETIQRLDFGAISAVASPIPVHEVMSTRRNMLTHARVLETIMAQQTILPVRFGVISATLDDLQRTLAPEADTLRAHLDRFDRRIEMGLKVRCEEAALMQAVVADRPDISARYQKLQAADANAVQFQKVELGREVAALRTAWRDTQREALSQRFGDVCESLVIHEAGDDDLELFSAAFLLKREDEPALMARVEQIDAEFNGVLTLKYVGPAPVYNFVSLRLNWTPPDAPAAAQPSAASSEAA